MLLAQTILIILGTHVNAQLGSQDRSANMKFHVLRIHVKTLELATMLAITQVMLVLAQKDSLEPTVSSEFHVYLSLVTTVLVSTTKTTKVTRVRARSVLSELTARHRFHATTTNAKTTQHVQTLMI